MRTEDRNSKYAGCYGDSLIAEFKTLTAALIWLEKIHKAGYSCNIRKVVNGVVAAEPINLEGELS